MILKKNICKMSKFYLNILQLVPILFSKQRYFFIVI